MGALQKYVLHHSVVEYPWYVCDALTGVARYDSCVGRVCVCAVHNMHKHRQGSFADALCTCGGCFFVWWQG